MSKFKNITIKKVGGGTRKQRVKVLASGKYKFVKNLGKSKSSSSGSKTKSTKKRKYMARRKRRRGPRSFTLPLAPTLAIVGQLTRAAPQTGNSMIGSLMAGDLMGAMQAGQQIFTGVDTEGGFHADWLVNTYGPIIIGALVHKFVGGKPLNINRMLASAGVPFIRI